MPAEGTILEEILDATYGVWSEGLSRQRYGLYYDAQRKTPWGRDHLTRTALMDGRRVLASAKEYDLGASLDGRPIRVVGIGALFTQPAERRKGHARALLDRLLARSAEQGFDLALLFSEIGAPYYERAGFVVLPTFDHYLDIARSSRGAPATLVRAGEERDLREIVALSSERLAPYRFHLERDREFIAYGLSRRRLLAGLGPRGAAEMHFFATDEGMNAVAYVSVNVKGGEWSLDECGDRDPNGARVGAILQGLLARDPAAARPVIKASLPPGFLPPQIAITRSMPAREIMMVRPLSRAGEAAAALGERDVCYWRGDLF